MDHSWNQLNQFNQQYQRLAAAATNSVAGNPRLDFPQAFLEQTAALATPGNVLAVFVFLYGTSLIELLFIERHLQELVIAASPL